MRSFENVFAWNRILAREERPIEEIQIIDQGNERFRIADGSADASFDVQASYRYESESGDVVTSDQKYRAVYRIWADSAYRTEDRGEFRPVYCSEA